MTERATDLLTLIEAGQASLLWAQTRIAELENLLHAILDAEEHFRDALPEEWDGDPIHDACERARAALAQSEEGRP